jgi:propanediol dehydratase small subunit
MALSDVGNPTKPPPVTTFVPESQPNEETLMGGTSTTTTPPAKLQGPSNTTDKNSIVPKSPAKLTTKSTGFPSGITLKEILAEKIKKAEKEIQSLQQAVKAQEARKPVVMNTQKPRSHKQPEFSIHKKQSPATSY